MDVTLYFDKLIDYDSLRSRKVGLKINERVVDFELDDDVQFSLSARELMQLSKTLMFLAGEL